MILFVAIVSFVLAAFAFGGVLFMYNFGMNSFFGYIDDYFPALTLLCVFVWHALPPMLVFLLGIKYIGKKEIDSYD